VALPAVLPRLEHLPGRRVLIPGCGLSSMGEQLASCGWEVLNADFSPQCIAIGREQTRGLPGISWEVMDCRDMPLPDASYDAVVDKGTLDALMCGDGFDVDVPRYITSMYARARCARSTRGKFLVARHTLRRVWRESTCFTQVTRVLTPGGRFVAYSLSQANVLLPLLREAIPELTVLVEPAGKYRLFIGDRLR
jgi:ubiquinone/menaquinone biosynthesis C-methylase UbiE